MQLFVLIVLAELLPADRLAHMHFITCVQVVDVFNFLCD